MFPVCSELTTCFCNKCSVDEGNMTFSWKIHCELGLAFNNHYMTRKGWGYLSFKRRQTEMNLSQQKWLIHFISQVKERRFTLALFCTVNPTQDLGTSHLDLESGFKH